jgi:hypothetical protein
VRVAAILAFPAEATLAGAEAVAVEELLPEALVAPLRLLPAYHSLMEGRQVRPGEETGERAGPQRLMSTRYSSAAGRTGPEEGRLVLPAVLAAVPEAMVEDP